MVYVIKVLRVGSGRPSWSYSQAVSKPVWHIPLLCVQWKTPEGGQTNCPKHVESYSKNRFEKLVRLVGFFIRTSHTNLLVNRLTCIGLRILDRASLW